MCAANEVALVDTMDGTYLYARATAGAEVVIDGREIVLYGDSTLRTGLLTFHTADTAVGAVLTYVCTLVIVGALDNHAYGVVEKVDDTVGALAYADTASDTLLRINASHAVLYGDSVLRADFSTVSVAEAGEGAELVTAVRHVGGAAGLVSLIVVLLLVDFAGTVAGYECNLFNNVLSGNAEHSRDLLSGAVTAGNTEVSLVGRLFCKSLCIAVTAGVAASTAVSTGETVTDSNGSLVLLHAEENARESKESSTYDSNTNENEGRNKNCHITTPFLCKQIFHNACKSEECKSNDGSCYESDGNTAERLGRGTVLNSRTNACEEDHCEKEAKTNAERGDHRLDEVVFCGDVVKGYAENCTVGGDEGKIYAERLVERGDKLLKHDLNELYESRDNENEYDSLKILELERNECVGVDGPGCRGSAKHYEGNCDAHTGCLIKLLGYAEKGAYTEELLENVVVYENSCHENEY